MRVYFLMHLQVSLSTTTCVSMSLHPTVTVRVVFQLSKGNCQYHKIFKEISKEEQLKQSKSDATIHLLHLKYWMRD